MVRSGWLLLVQERYHGIGPLSFVDHKIPVNLDRGLQKQRLSCSNCFSFFFKEAMHSKRVIKKRSIKQMNFTAFDFATFQGRITERLQEKLGNEC